MSIGIIKYINSTISYMQDSLWVGYNNSYNGRSFRLKRKNTNRVIPEVYQDTSNESEEVFVNDNYDSIVHFDFDPVIPKNGKYGATTSVNIIFAVNLAKVYSGVNRAVSVEKAKKDINNILVTSPFDVQNIVEYPDALNDYDIDPKEEHKFNMQPYFVVKFECSSNHTLNDECISIEPDTYDLTISDNGNGTTEPFQNDTQTYNKNRIIPINATPDPGFKFVKWLINGIEDLASLTYVKMTNNISAIAEFAVSVIKQLTIGVSGNGTTNPAPGIYDYEAGTIVPITAIENDELYYFNEFTINGVPNSNNPIAPQINDNTTVVAYFNEYTQWVFDNSIIKIGTNYYYDDKTSNNNNVKIKNTQIAKFDGIGSKILITPINIGSSHTISFIVEAEITESLQGLASSNDANNDLIRMFDGNRIDYRVGGESLIFSGLTEMRGKSTKIEISRSVADVSLYVDDVFIETKSLTTQQNTDFTISNLMFNAGLGWAFQGNVCCIEIDGVLKYYFQEGQGSTIYNQLGTGNTGTVTGANLLDFWSEKSEFANPALLIYGYEQYESDTTPGDYIYVIFANGVAQSPTITGYSIIKTIQPNIGFSDTGSTLDGLEIVGLELDATFNDVFSLEDTSSIDITKTSNTVTQLKIK